MGPNMAGKTSMHSIIFANYPVKDVMGIGCTIDINETKFRFMGNLTLNLWDCGGQDKLMKHYLSAQKETIFKNVEVLIYVFAVDGKDTWETDLDNYKKCIENLAHYSKNANIFILIHKMDKIKDSEKQIVFEKKKKIISDYTVGLEIKEVFGTSIWDETLYKAWSQIVQHLVPNMNFIKDSLKQFCSICDSEEIVLFEKSTFLIIAYYETKPHKDILKYERISNIIKQFKLSVTKLRAKIQSIFVRNTNFTAIIQEFTENTYIMIVYSDPKIQPAAIELNIDCAKKFFQKHCKSEMENLFFSWNKS